MRGKEKGGAVDLGKGVGGLDDAVAEALQHGAVDRVEDGVLEDDGVDLVFRAWM